MVEVYGANCNLNPQGCWHTSSRPKHPILHWRFGQRSCVVEHLKCTVPVQTSLIHLSRHQPLNSYMYAACYWISDLYKYAKCFKTKWVDMLQCTIPPKWHKRQPPESTSHGWDLSSSWIASVRYVSEFGSFSGGVVEQTARSMEHCDPTFFQHMQRRSKRPMSFWCGARWNVSSEAWCLLSWGILNCVRQTSGHESGYVVTHMEHQLSHQSASYIGSPWITVVTSTACLKECPASLWCQTPVASPRPWWSHQTTAVDHRHISAHEPWRLHLQSKLCLWWASWYLHICTEPFLWHWSPLPKSCSACPWSRSCQRTIC